MRAPRRRRTCWSVLLVGSATLLAGCGTEPAVRAEPPSNTTPNTTLAVAAPDHDVPASVPRFVFGFIRSQPYPRPDPYPYPRSDPSLGEPTKIVRVDRQTGEQLELLSETTVSESWSGNTTVEFAGLDVSPDGQTIVFTASWIDAPVDDRSAGSGSTPDPGSALYRMPADGPGAVELIGSNDALGPTAKFRSVRFSPDGQWVGVASGPVVAFSVDGGAPIKSTAGAEYADERVSWSPDGSRLAVSSHYERPGSGATSVLNFDAAARVLSRSDTRVPDSESPWWDRAGALHVLPAGQQILLAADTDGSYEWVLGVDQEGGYQPCTPRACTPMAAPVTWWPSSEDPPTGRTLPGSFPDNFVPMAW